MNSTQQTITKLHIGLETSGTNLEIHPSEAIDIITEYISGGTFIESKGLWHGTTENSLIFKSANIRDMATQQLMDELHESNTDDPVQYLKDVLETELEQDSVMVTESTAEVTF